MARGTLQWLASWMRRGPIRTEAPDVVQKVRILEVSPAIPNDTLAFGPEFPEAYGLKSASCWITPRRMPGMRRSAARLSSWTGIDTATDEEYIRPQNGEAVGLTLEDLGQ
jgi:phosphonate transport system substrate-binding protein